MSKTIEAIEVLTKTVAELADRVIALETKPVVKIEPEPTESKFPIPMEYREVVKTILNGKFNVDLDYSTDAAAFSLHILVPQEYSNAGKAHWEMYKEDRRTRVIMNALGVNGVREWCQKVYESFDMETRSKIANDRAMLV